MEYGILRFNLLNSSVLIVDAWGFPEQIYL